MSKHTPGPWIGAGPSFGAPLPLYTTEIVTEAEDDDGEVRTICTMPPVEYDEENEANALLIAAAPELLEALTEMLAEDDGGRAAEKARQAITKATGVQP